MPRPKASLVCFANTDKATCLEMEYAVGGQSRLKVDDQVRKLIKAAEDQGWDVRISGNRLKWYAPDGKLATATPPQVYGSGLQHLRTQLRQSGLELPEDAKTGKSVTVAAEPEYVELPDDPVTPEQALEVLMEYITNEQRRPDVEELESRLDASYAQAQALLSQRDEARAQVKSLQGQVADQLGMLQDIKAALSKPSWEVLPEIARICGVKT